MPNCNHLSHKPNGICRGCGERHQPLADWQEHFDDYCRNEFGGREPSGREHDEAAAYADQMMEEEGE